MKIINKKALNVIEAERLIEKSSDLIIANKTYSVNELNAIFNYNSLMLVESREELIKYWQMAIETGIKRFITVVDNVFNERYPRYE